MFWLREVDSRKDFCCVHQVSGRFSYPGQYGADIYFFSFGGVVLVSTSDSAQKDFSTPPTNRVPRPLLGDFLALISALFYALYVTLLKLRIQHESRIDMQLFFGFVGLFNILLLWPMGILLHLFGVELFEWPHGKKVIAGILMNVSRHQEVHHAG